MSIYSVRLVGGVASVSPETLYTVPTGAVIVVRDISLTNETGAAASTVLGIQVSGGFNVPIFSTGTINSGITAIQSGRWVMAAGDSLVLTSSALNWGIYVSGYSLT